MQPPAPWDMLTEDELVWAITRLPLDQPRLSLAVAIGQFASRAAWTYHGVIAAKAFDSAPMRWQAAVMGLGLMGLGGILHQLNNRWQEGLEMSFQRRILPWLRVRCRTHSPDSLAHYSTVLQRLDSLAVSQAWLLSNTVGSVGSMAGSIAAALRETHDSLTLGVVGPMLMLSVATQGIDIWWTRRTQQRHTDLSVEYSRSTYALIAALPANTDTSIEAKVEALSLNRRQRYTLANQGLGLSTGQGFISSVGDYALLYSLGWFAGDISTAQLTAVQGNMAIAQSLVYAALTLPSCCVDQMQMHARIRSDFNAEPLIRL